MAFTPKVTLNVLGAYSNQNFRGIGLKFLYQTSILLPPSNVSD